MFFAFLEMMKASYDLSKAEREMYREMREEARRQELRRQEEERKRIEREKRIRRYKSIAMGIVFFSILAYLVGSFIWMRYAH